MNDFSSEDKIQLLWHLSNEYSNNIMFDVQAPYEDTRYLLPIILLRDAAYLPFKYKGMEVKPRHVG